MPYKLESDRIANKKLYERTLAWKKFRAMGLEPLDLNDPHSKLVCNFCAKETGRSAMAKTRHCPDCPSANQENLLRYPVKNYA